MTMSEPTLPITAAAGGYQHEPTRQMRLSRGGGGRLAGAVTGFLSAAVALGAATLAAAFVRPQASPVIAVGGAAIDRTPPAVKVWATEHFGTYDKLALLAGIFTVVALIAMLIGVLARRSVVIGIIGIVLFGGFGAFVALSRPESRLSDVLPSLAGAAAGVIAITALSAASMPRWPPVRTGRSRWAAEPGIFPRVNRRRFLLTSASAVAAAAVAGAGGQALSSRRFNVSASRAAVKLRKPVSAARTPAAGADLKIPGLSPFYTPNPTFYRVDTALVTPQVTTEQWSLRVHGMVDKPLQLSFSDLMNMPQIARDITICCVSETVGGPYVGNARWQGVRLATILRAAGIQPGADQIVSRDVNGMSIGTPSAVVMDGRDALLAFGMNGEPLPAEHGFPVRMVVPGLYGYVSACKWIVDMELTTFAAYDAYWTHHGWSQQAPVKTESRIDTPKAGPSLSAGTVTIAGVAWATHKGIAEVEVGIDGTWRKAKLAAQDTISTWRQWYLTWDASPGRHTIQVRAIDQTGYTQTAVKRRTRPDGATGYHTVQVNVA